MRTPSILPLSLLTSAILCANAQSADKDPLLMEELEVNGQQNDGYLIKESRSATKLSLDLFDTPQSISIVGRDQIDDFALTDIRDLLDTVPGVTVERTETDRVTYAARGFEIDSFQIDGISQSFRSRRTSSDRDTAVFERVEVIRGANGLMTGVGNPSATVNMVRKRPTDNTQVSVGATAGSWHDLRIELDASGQLSERVGARAVAVKHTADSYLDRYEKDKELFYGVVDFDITDNSKLTLGHSFENSDSDSPLWGSLPLYYSDGSATDFDTNTSTSSDWSFWNSETQQSFIELDQRLSENWNLLAIYTHTKIDEDSDLFYVYGTPDADTGLGLTGYGSEYLLDSDEDSLDIYIDGEFTLAGRSHQLVVGASRSEYDYQENSLYDYTTGNGFPAMPALENWDGNTPYPTFADGAAGSDTSSELNSIYASARFSITDDLHVLAGARSVDWQAEGESYGVSQDSNADEVVPYFGATFSFAGHYSLYASYSEVFTPQVEQDISGRSLDPITGESSEVGVKAKFFDERLQTSVSYFDTEQLNLAVSQGINPATGRAFYSAADGINSKGYEVEASGELFTGLQASLGYTDFNIDGDDTVADYTPEQLLKLSATYQLNDFKFGANLNWQSDITRVQQTDANGNATITSKQDAYALVNLMASYDISDKLTATVNAYNVTNEKHLSSLQRPQSYYGAPRSYSASINYSF